MARPQIEFIQSQSLPWTPDTRFSLGDGVDIKLLSEDDETGAVSLLARYPAGWSAPAGAKGADEEFLVLHGDLSVEDAHYGHLAYAHWPRGYPTGVRRSETGAVALTFFSGDPREPAPQDFDRARLVARVDTYETPYTGNFHPDFPPGAGRKVMFTDPQTRETSWILGTLPVRWAERAELHDDVEEMYLLSGETHGDRGVMRPGAYFWRPGNIVHGPYGTLTGNLYFFRTKGGPLVTRYVDPHVPFRWHPPYDPVLPEELKALAREAPAGPECW